MRNCRNCIYWSGVLEESGLCRFPSPAIGNDGTAVWPETDKDMTCGQGLFRGRQLNAEAGEDPWIEVINFLGEPVGRFRVKS